MQFCILQNTFDVWDVFTAGENLEILHNIRQRIHFLTMPAPSELLGVEFRRSIMKVPRSHSVSYPTTVIESFTHLNYDSKRGCWHSMVALVEKICLVYFRPFKIPGPQILNARSDPRIMKANLFPHISKYPKGFAVLLGCELLFWNL